jgi:DNA primase
LNSEKLTILKNVLGSYYTSNNEKLFNCPSCNHTKKKMSINVEKNVFKCWVCDYSGKDLEFLVKKHGSYSQLHEWRKLNKVDMVTASPLDEIFSEKREESVEIDLDLPVGFVSLSEDTKESAAAIEYLTSRGITKRDMLIWKLGFAFSDEYNKRVIVPSFDCKGNLNYFVGRTYDDSCWPRYKNPNCSKDIIFNDLLIDWSKPITLVEGVFDAMKAHNAIALLGSTLRENSKLFKKIIKYKPKVFVALDKDAYAKSLKLCKSLTKYDIETNIIILGDDDIADMSSEEVENLYNTASVIDSDNYLLYEISKI